jgi:hypothetical protein
MGRKDTARWMGGRLKLQFADDFLKARMEAAFIKGYEKGYGVEDMKPANERTAKRLFDQWYTANHESDAH